MEINIINVATGQPLEAQIPKSVKWLKQGEIIYNIVVRKETIACFIHRIDIDLNHTGYINLYVVPL